MKQDCLGGDTYIAIFAMQDILCKNYFVCFTLYDIQFSFKM